MYMCYEAPYVIRTKQTKGMHFSGRNVQKYEIHQTETMCFSFLFFFLWFRFNDRIIRDSNACHACAKMCVCNKCHFYSSEFKMQCKMDRIKYSALSGFRLLGASFRRSSSKMITDTCTLACICIYTYRRMHAECGINWVFFIRADRIML